MSRVPEHPLPGKIVRVKAAASIAEQKAFLADLDRRVAVIEAKTLDKNGNYDKD